VDRVEASLAAAIARGVDVRLLFEQSATSGGSLRYDGFAAFDRRVLDGASLYGWKQDLREVGPSGNTALMHAKAIVADAEVMLITSANLSGAALERNLEVGVIVRGGPQPRWLHERFESLLSRSLLEEIRL
jgi:phosphatidylserine/phosphatidylglycerophosphate/cardiolipin synthase-like enzyme